MTSDSQSVADQIGLTAGKVWHLLADQGEISLAKLAKQVETPRDLVMQSVGWLARENKIQIVAQKRGKTISLIPEEQIKAA
jgi:hypothetical protein